MLNCQWVFIVVLFLLLGTIFASASLTSFKTVLFLTTYSLNAKIPVGLVVALNLYISSSFSPPLLTFFLFPISTQSHLVSRVCSNLHYEKSAVSFVGVFCFVLFFFLLFFLHSKVIKAFQFGAWLSFVIPPTHTHTHTHTHNSVLSNSLTNSLALIRFSFALFLPSTLIYNIS